MFARSCDSARSFNASDVRISSNMNLENFISQATLNRAIEIGVFIPISHTSRQLLQPQVPRPPPSPHLSLSSLSLFLASAKKISSSYSDFFFFFPSSYFHL